MPRVAKLIVAGAVLLMGLASMGMVGLRDSLKRPEFCVLCHSNPYYTSWEDSEYLATKHARAAISCQRCHPRSVTTAARNILIQLTRRYRLKRIRVPKEACFRCHAHASYDDLIERTGYINLDFELRSNSASDGERSANWFVAQNPHRAHHYGDLDCRICHKMHRPSEEYCSECHEPATSAAGWIIQERRKGYIPTPGGLPSPQ